jgi:AraC-like DNA-binding protein
MGRLQSSTSHLQVAPAGDAGTLRAAVLFGIPAALRELGFDPRTVLAGAGVDTAALDHPDNRLTFKSAGELLKHSVALTGCRHFGLLAGRHLDASSLGPLGELIQRSATVRSALMSLIDHLHLQTRGGVPTLDVQGSSAAFGYAIYLLDTPGTALGYDLVMAFEFNLLKAVCGPFWRPTEVRFAHGRPQDQRPYQKLFNCTLRFDADRSALLFNANWLDKPPMRSDPEHYRRLQREILAQEMASPHDQVDRVRRTLRTMALNGLATEEALADLFSMSTRTLHRLLAARSTSYKKLLDEARYEVARQLLVDTDLSPADLAMSLGYSDATALNRAFRRWTNLPPGVWRAKARAESLATPEIQPPAARIA